MKDDIEKMKNKPVTVEKKHAETRFAGKTWPQVYALVSVSFGMLTAGTLFTWPSPAIPKLISDYGVTIEEASFLPVIPPITMVLATPLACALLDKIGRKKNLILMGIIHVICWLIIAFAPNIYVFYVSRAIGGFADALSFSTVPAYIAESATPRVRGRYGNAMMILMFIGQFAINCVGYYTSIRTTAFVMLVFPCLFFMTFLFMPESPYYCIMKDDQEGARKALIKLRRIQDVEPELKQITADVQRQMSESSKFTDLWNIKSNRMAIVVANIARGIQQFSGISALLVYAQYIFELAGGDISSGHASMIFSGALAIANIFGNLIADKLGRNRSMVVSSFGCGLSLLGETIYFYLQTNTDIDVSSAGWFPVFGLMLYILAFVSGIGVVPTLLLGELFSTSIRSKAAIVTNIVFAIYLSGINYLFQYLMTSFGLWVPFLFFTICLFASSVLSHFTIPETKGKTLEEIQQMLKGSSKK